MSHGIFCGMSLLAPSQSHEMGKHEIKVEKPHKSGGRRMTRVWLGVGGEWEGRGGLSPHPRTQETPGLSVP